MEDVLPLEQRPQRTHRMRWFDIPDLVGWNCYDAPNGDPLSALDEMDLEEINSIWGEGFTGEVLLSGYALARSLPGDTYVPVDTVVAVLTAALWWGKAVDVSWLQMDYDPLSCGEVPIQHHRTNAAVMYLDDDDLMFFGVAAPEDLDGPARVMVPCVTNIRLVLTPPLAPKPAEQLPAGLQVDG